MSELSVLLNICAKDDFELFKLSLDSVFDQTFLPSEVLVVSDGPARPDQKKLIKEKMLKSATPIRLIETDVPRGLWYARNYGLANLSSKYVALMDSDDVMHPDRLRIQLKFLRANKDVSVLGTSAIEIDSKSKLILGIRMVPTEHLAIKKILTKVNPIIHPSVVLERQKIIDIGGYKEYFLAEDYELWTRLIGAGAEIANLNEALLGFHMDNDLQKRRGSFKFIVEEIKLRNQIIKNLNLQWNQQQILVLLVRIIYRTVPHKLRGAIYNFIFRKKPNPLKNKYEDDFVSSPPISQN